MIYNRNNCQGTHLNCLTSYGPSGCSNNGGLYISCNNLVVLKTCKFIHSLVNLPGMLNALNRGEKKIGRAFSFFHSNVVPSLIARQETDDGGVVRVDGI